MPRSTTLEAPRPRRMVSGLSLMKLGGGSFRRQSSFDIVEVLAAVGGAEGIQRAIVVVGEHSVGCEGGDALVGLLGEPQRELGRFTWRDGVDQRARGVVD